MALCFTEIELCFRDIYDRPVGSNYRLGGGGGTHKFFYRLGGGAHINLFIKMTDLCNEQYSIIVQIIGGHGPPCPPIPTALYEKEVLLHVWFIPAVTF